MRKQLKKQKRQVKVTRSFAGFHPHRLSFVFMQTIPTRMHCTLPLPEQNRTEQGQLHFLHFMHKNSQRFSPVLICWHAVLPAVCDAKLCQVEKAGYTLFCSRNTVLPSRFIQTSVSLLSVSHNSNYVCFWKPQVPRH